MFDGTGLTEQGEEGANQRERRPCQAEFPANLSARTLQGLLALTIQPVPRQPFRP